MRKRTALGMLVLASAAIGLSACGGKTGGDEGERVGIGRAALKRAMSCDDLLGMLQADAITKENIRIDAMLEEIDRYGGGMPPARGGDVAGEGGMADAEAPALSGDSGDSDNAGQGASEYSRTNTQVDGVDEADIVKTDGKSIYLVHGGRFFILDAWPAESLAEGASVEIEGEPLEMFVDGDRALVYSRVNGDPIYEEAGVEPKGEFGYGYPSYPGEPDIGIAEPDIGSIDDDGVDGGAPEDPPQIDEADANFVAPYHPGSPYGRTQLLKVTVLSLDGGNPTVKAEHWFEGDYRSSRRMGDKIRTVLQGGHHGPTLQHFPEARYEPNPAAARAAFEQLRHENIGKIAATTIADWLPYEMRREGGAIVADTPACESFYAPTAGTTEHGLVQVKSIDWAAPSTVGGVNILGRADHVYANESSMYLAAAAWNDGYVFEAYRNLPEERPFAIVTSRTHVHKLDLTQNPDEPVYVASGTVNGTILDQFSLDEHRGKLRIATTEDRMVFYESSGGWDDSVGVGVDTDVAEPGGDFAGSSNDAGSNFEEPLPEPAPMPTPDARIGKQSAAIGASAEPPAWRVNRLFVLEQQGDDLAQIGDVGELAPDERIYSARFVGEKGYLVTFRQVDPLFVIDLADPANPTLLGELEIPGFSNYMHPIANGYLLTIGQDAGVTNGLAIQLFDVTEPTSPKLQSKYVFEAPWGSSQAQHNHKAFTWYPSRNLLAFPYAGFDGTRVKSSLELISVDIQAGAAALSAYGSVDHSAFFGDTPGGYCGGYYGVDVRRGLFLDDVIYSISYGGVMAHDLSDLATPIASLPLSAPHSDSSCGWGG